MNRFWSALWYEGLVLRWLFWPLSIVYRALAALRRELYRFGLLKSVRLSVPVVVVGNITAGGTGKTPCVIWLARALQDKGYRVGIVSRGYGGQCRDWPQPVMPDGDPDLFGDEPVLIASRTACPVVVAPDRVAAAQRLLSEHDVDVVLSDDGLQHYRLRRDFELVVIDGTRGLGNGMCLPAGPLREPRARLRRVDAVVVNSGAWGHPGAHYADMKVSRVYRLADGMEASLEDFRGRRAHAVAGIGNPRRFFDMLAAAGLELDARPLADHARIAAEDLQFDDGAPVMMTEKDAVKCREFASESMWCVCVDLHFDDGDEDRLIDAVVDRLSLGD